MGFQCFQSSKKEFNMGNSRRIHTTPRFSHSCWKAPLDLGNWDQSTDDLPATLPTPNHMRPWGRWSYERAHDTDYIVTNAMNGYKFKVVSIIVRKCSGINGHFWNHAPPTQSTGKISLNLGRRPLLTRLIMRSVLIKTKLSLPKMCMQNTFLALIIRK